MKKNSLALNTILLSIGTLLNKGLQFIMIPFFSAWLSTEDYGTFDLLCTYVSLLIPIVTLASSEAVFRLSIDQENNHKEKSKYITSVFILDTINIVILALVCVATYIYSSWQLAIPFLLLAIGEIFNNYFQGYMRGIKKLNIYSFCMAISTVLIAIFVTLFVKVFGLGLSGIIYGYAIGYIAGDLLIAVITKFWRYFSLKNISLRTMKEAIKYSFPLIFNNVFWWIVNVSDRSIIKMFLGASANGVYAIANKVPALCTAVFGMFSISWQQTASEMIDNKDRNEYFNKIFNKTTAILISLCAGILSINFILFDFVFDIKYSDARYQAPILVFSIIFYTISQFLGGIQISLKRPKENGITTVIGAIVNVIVNLMLIKYIGLYAASISTIISNFIVVIIRKVRLNKDVKLNIERKNLIFAIYFIYMFICQYLVKSYILCFINIFIAILMFIYINKEFFKVILSKFKKILLKTKSA